MITHAKLTAGQLYVLVHTKLNGKGIYYVKQIKIKYIQIKNTGGKMAYDKEEIQNKLKIWEEKLQTYKLPTWEELPVFELYMDQVTGLINQYLSILSEDEEKPLTPSMINNYVKLKILPPPVKKRYSRLHLVYLIMICILKQSLEISMIRNCLPSFTDEESVGKAYNEFAEIQNRAFKNVTKQVKEKAEGDLPQSLITEIAVKANVYNIIAERLGKK